MDPGESLAILESEIVVGRVGRHGGIPRDITVDDFHILARAGVSGPHEGQRQQRQRIGLYQKGAGGGRVVEIVVSVGSQHFIGVDRRSLIHRIGISH